MKKIKSKFITRQLDCLLTDDEIKTKATDLAHAVQAKNQILLEFKEVKTGFRSRIEEQDIIMQDSSNAINNGKEPRPVECEVKLNTPNSGIKTFIRKDTGEEWTEDMMFDELQEELDI